MKKIGIWLCCLSILLVMGGCTKQKALEQEKPIEQQDMVEQEEPIEQQITNAVEEELNQEQSEGNVDEPSELATVYSLALEASIPIDEGLNGDMPYIAINGESLVDATEEDIQDVLRYFEKYSPEIKNASFKKLEEDGFVGKGNAIEGLLMDVEEVETMDENHAVVHVSKFRSGLGAVGVKVTLDKTDAGWEVKDSEATWIS